MDRKEFRRVLILAAIFTVMCFWLGGCGVISGIGRDVSGASYGIALSEVRHTHKIMKEEDDEAEYGPGGRYDFNTREGRSAQFARQSRNRDDHDSEDERPEGWTRQRWEYYLSRKER